MDDRYLEEVSYLRIQRFYVLFRSVSESLQMKFIKYLYPIFAILLESYMLI